MMLPLAVEVLIRSHFLDNAENGERASFASGVRRMGAHGLGVAVPDLQQRRKLKMAGTRIFSGIGRQLHYQAGQEGELGGCYGRPYTRYTGTVPGE